MCVPVHYPLTEHERTWLASVGEPGVCRSWAVIMWWCRYLFCKLFLLSKWFTDMIFKGCWRVHLLRLFFFLIWIGEQLPSLPLFFFFFIFTWLSSSMCDQCALSWTRGMIYTICLHLAVPTVMHWAFCLPCLPAGSLWRNLDWYTLLSTSGARLFCKMQIKVAFCSWTSGCF